MNRLVRSFFGENTSFEDHKLPFRLHQWMIREIQSGGARLTNRSFKTLTTFSRHGRILVAILLKQSNNPNYLLYLEEDSTALEDYENISRRLTRRQLEMYHLIKDGERNIAVIAQKMGISVRTAEGHKMNLQRIIGGL